MCIGSWPSDFQYPNGHFVQTSGRCKTMTDKLCFDMGHVCDAAGKIEPTKRNIISAASRFYDPLGVLSPFAVRFKILPVSRAPYEGGWMGRTVIR